MVESNANLYLGEEMMGLHQESLETFFRDGTNDDGHGGGGGGGGADSPGGGREVSESGTVGADGSSRPRSQSSQVGHTPSAPPNNEKTHQSKFTGIYQC